MCRRCAASSGRHFPVIMLMPPRLQRRGRSQKIDNPRKKWIFCSTALIHIVALYAAEWFHSGVF